MITASTPSRRLSLIFAVARNGVIGKSGGLPWDYPEDRAFFLEKTRRHAVIMGRRTWDERGSALPDRTNIVISRTFAAPENEPSVLVVRTLQEALAAAWAIDDEPFVIGGARIFEEAMPLATRIYLTEIPGCPEGDTFFTFDRSRFEVVDERLGDQGLRFCILEPRLTAGRRA